MIGEVVRLHPNIAVNVDADGGGAFTEIIVDGNPATRWGVERETAPSLGMAWRRGSAIARRLGLSAELFASMPTQGRWRR